MFTLTHHQRPHSGQKMGNIVKMGFLNTQRKQRLSTVAPVCCVSRLDVGHLALDGKVGPTVKCTHVLSFGHLRSDGWRTEAVAML